MSQRNGREFFFRCGIEQTSSSLLTDRWTSVTYVGYIHDQELP